MDIKMRGIFWEASGYATMTRHLFWQLYKHGVNIVPENMSRVRSPQYETPQELIDAMLAQSRYTPLLGHATVITTWIPEMWQYFSEEYNVGFTMLESTRINPDWANRCNAMDEVWVPSIFNLNTFIDSGVHADRLFVMPLGVDTNVFHPEVTPFDFGFKEDFKLFSNFEWVPRKNMEAMLYGYFQAFEGHDDVVLVLLTYSLNDPNVMKEVKATIDQLKVPFKKTPKIAIVSNSFAIETVAQIAKSANLYITMAHGEGWGLPLLESMAVGVPVLAPDWSAYKDFLTEEEGYLNPIVGLESVPRLGSFYDRIYGGSKWAVPDLEAYVYTLRHAYEHRDELREKGERAAERAKLFTWEKSAEKVIHRVSEIQYNLTKSKIIAFPKKEVPRVVEVVPSLGKQCGVAEYTINLMESIPDICMGGYAYGIDHDDSVLDKVSRSNIIHCQVEYGLWNHGHLKHFASVCTDKIRVATLHSVEPRLYDYNMTLVNNFDAVILHSERIKLSFPNNDKTIVMPMGCKDYNQIPKTRNKIQIIGSFGIMFPQKGFFELALAMKELEPLGYRWLLFSSVSEQNPTSVSTAKKFQQFIDNIGLTNIQWVHDYLREPDIVTALSQSVDLIVLPYTEFRDQVGVSAAAKTCLASMTPMITSDISFFSDLPDDVVIRIPDNRPQTIAEKILSFDLNEYNTISKNMYEFVKANTWNKVGDKYRILFNNLLRGEGRI